MSDYDAAFQAASTAVSGGKKPVDEYDAIMAAIAPKMGGQPQVAQEVGKAVNANLTSIPRQIGLTARYALEGPAQAAQIFTEPIAGLMRSAGIPTKSLGELAGSFADMVGLPQPQGANERVIGDATRLVAGSGGFAGAANAASKLPGMLGSVMTGLAANPTQQLSSAAGAGLLGGASKEAGGNPLLQTGAALVGGLAGAVVPGAIGGVANMAKRAVTPAMNPQQIDIKLSSILAQSGTDYSQLPEQVQSQLRKQMSSALQTGQEVSPDALRRLADFNTVGATPTRGMISQNPVQITREMNLAKTAAASLDDQLSGLPMLQNQNNNTLIRNLNDAGATTGDAFKAGQGILNRITATNQGLTQARDSAYAAARGMPGAKDPLYPDAARNIFNALDDKGIVGDLPPTISNYLNAFVKGPQKGPLGEMVPGPSFNVQAYENLQKQLSNAAMSPDSSTRYAAGVARRALEDTKIQPITQTGRDFGNLPVTQDVAGLLRAKDGQAQALLDQLNQGRAAHKTLMQYGESTPVVKAIVGGAEPDKIFQKFVLGGTLADAQSVATNAPNSGVKEAILAHLKDKALNGASDEVGKFSQSGFNKALSAIGDRKLQLFFNPEEIANLQSVGRVSSYMQTQPVGSAVNNSNSATTLMGALPGLLNSVANKIPFGQSAIVDPLRNINISMQQRQAQNYLPGLLMPQSKASNGNLLLPAVALGGGLLSP